jgi:hypothetical protein
MIDLRHVAVVAAMVCTLAPLTHAEEIIPPLPLKSEVLAATSEPLPEMHSPCTFDMDAMWIKPLKTSRTELKTKAPPLINCDGAVIKSVLARGSGSATTFQFTVAFRQGQDREAIISFGILDNEKQLVALGETRDNLDEGDNSYLIGTLMLKNREFDRIFAKGQKPVLRVTIRIEGS